MSTLEAYIKEGTRPHLFTHSLIIIYSKEKDKKASEEGEGRRSVFGLILSHMSWKARVFVVG